MDPKKGAHVGGIALGSAPSSSSSSSHKSSDKHKKDKKDRDERKDASDSHSRKEHHSDRKEHKSSKHRDEKSKKHKEEKSKKDRDRDSRKEHKDKDKKEKHSSSSSSSSSSIVPTVAALVPSVNVSGVLGGLLVGSSDKESSGVGVGSKKRSRDDDYHGGSSSSSSSGLHDLDMMDEPSGKRTKTRALKMQDATLPLFLLSSVLSAVHQSILAEASHSGRKPHKTKLMQIVKETNKEVAKQSALKRWSQSDIERALAMKNEGKSHSEIAATLNKTIVAVNSKLSALKKKHANSNGSFGSDDSDGSRSDDSISDESESDLSGSESDGSRSRSQSDSSSVEDD